MHPPASSSIHLHSATSRSIHLHPTPSTSTQLHPPIKGSFQPPLSSLQHPQRYKNQNIACNWAISPNWGCKIQSWPFCLKFVPHGILEVLIPNLDLNFWISAPKIYFRANLGWKSQSCLLWLKTCTHGIYKMLILIATLCSEF